MALEQKLHLKLAQKLVMTPTLQQAIKLLQLSRLELEQALSQELQVNPVLELSEDVPADEEVEVPEEDRDEGGQSTRLLDDGEPALPAEAAGETGDAEPAVPETPSEASYGEVELEALFGNYLHDTARAAATWEDEEEPPLENSPAPEASMFDSLVAQLHLEESPIELRLACEYVIGNLDPDGYLRTSDEDLAAQLGVDTATIELAVAAVQRLDPPGIAARSVSECLTLQLDRYAWPVDPDAFQLTRRLVAEAFDDLLHQRWERITQRFGIDRDTIRQVLDVVRRLNPRPGSQLGPNDNPAVEPDVVVTKVDGVWRVSLNDEGFPRLRLSGQYVRLLKSRTMDSETNGYLRERLRAALWFLRSVEQRQSTIMKVSEAIVRRQEEFLERGLSHLRPLVLRDIADDIGMHESTVSRVVANKYIATPRGVYPLKFFFHSSISHAVQGDISSLVVKERIRALIAEEEPRRPLSDARVARQLNRLGIRIARRTVAKYREELGIPSSEQRRRVLR